MQMIELVFTELEYAVQMSFLATAFFLKFGNLQVSAVAFLI
jgi:hypothetical protein